MEPVKLLADAGEDFEGDEVVCGFGGAISPRAERAGVVFQHWIEFRDENCEGFEEEEEEEEATSGPKKRVTKETAHQARERSKKCKKSGKLLQKLLEDETNLYKILNLEELGWKATPEDIRRNYKRALLKLHPDKRGGAFSDTDPEFLLLQEANEILCDVDLRRGYDSEFDFDEDLPVMTAEEVAADNDEFFSVFGAAFEANSRFSVVHPCPLFGSSKTDIKKVKAFYKFWRRFESWRVFFTADEHNLDEAECREEKRWMQRQNDNARARRKKEEIRRVQSLVETAAELDPRLRREKEEELRRRTLEKAVREAEKARAEEMAKMEADRAEEERVMEEERKEAAKRAAADLKKRFRRAVLAAPAEVRPAEVLVKLMKKHIALEKMAEVVELVEGLSKAERPAWLGKEVPGLVEIATKKQDEELARQKAAMERLSSSSKSKKAATIGPEWSCDELQLLVKAVAKYPGGTRNRWQVIASHINHTLGLMEERTAQMCIARAKTLRTSADVGTTAFQNTKAVAGSIGQAKASVNFDRVPLPPSSPSPPPAVQNAWSAVQQKALESALGKFKAAMPKKERWTAIAAEVEGKSRKECFARFQFLREQLLKAKARKAKAQQKK